MSVTIVLVLNEYDNKQHINAKIMIIHFFFINTIIIITVAQKGH